MSKKPVELQLLGLRTPRERVWDAVIKLAKPDQSGTFTAWDAQDACAPMVKFDIACEYMRHLAKAGYLAEVKKAKPMKEHGNRLSTPVYRLVKQQGDAPRVNVAGGPALKGQGNEAMWTAMKVLPSFDFRDIAMAASMPGKLVVAETTARLYVGALARAGYFTTLRKPTRLLPGRYALALRTGMHAPAVTRIKTVFDRNTGKFAHLETAQEVCDGLE